MLRFYDEVEGCVRCIFFKLHPLQRADAEAIDTNFSSSGPFAILVWWDLDQMVRM